MHRNFGRQSWKALIWSTTLAFVVYDSLAIFQHRDAIAQALSNTWPYATLLLAYILCRYLAPRSPSKALVIVLILAISAIQMNYLIWRLSNTLVLNWTDGWFSLGLFAYEVLRAFNTWMNNGLLMAATQRSEEADTYRYSIQTGEYRPSVDIFIPSYNEPMEVLRRSLIGCRAMKYPRENKRIWLLDDGDRPEMKRLAQELRCHYIARPEHDHAKAGNLNYALQQTNGDIVVVFDADFIPLNLFLERTLGFFYHAPEMAMVVTPQHFYNPEPPQRNLGHRFIPGDQVHFYHLIQPSRDAANAVVCSGSAIVYRRSALQAIGGIPTDSIVEDYITGMMLQARGFKTAYLNEVLSVGAAANTIDEYLKQRARWAEGTLATACDHYNPIRVKGLNPLQRCIYLSGILAWLEEILKLLSYTAPILYFLLGIQGLHLSFDQATLIGLYSYGLIMVTQSWIRGSHLLNSLYNLLQGFHVFRVALNIFIWPKHHIKFKVTDKALADYQTRLNTRTLAHIFVLLGLTLASILYGIHQGLALDHGIGFLYLVWAQVNAILLATAIVAGASTPRDRGYPRVKCQVACRITRADGSHGHGTVVDISEGGAGIRLEQPMDLQRHETIHLEMPDIRIRVQAEVRHPDKVVGCLFVDPDFKTLWKLINFSYCRAEHWSIPALGTESKTIQAIIAGLYQLHPFYRRR